MNYKILNVANVVETIQQMGCDLNVIKKLNKWKKKICKTVLKVATNSM